MLPQISGHDSGLDLCRQKPQVCFEWKGGLTFRLSHRKKEDGAGREEVLLGRGVSEAYPGDSEHVTLAE